MRENVFKNKNTCFIFLYLFILLSALYTIGIFDMFLKRDLLNEKYDVGGFTFTGQSLSGKFDGEGEINFSDNSTYKGNFKDVCFDGDGIFKSPDGWELSGTFDKGNIFCGILKLKNGGSLSYKDGECEYTSENGWRYVGKVNEMGQTSQGTFYYADGGVYNGSFAQGLAEEEGVYESKDRRIVYSGTFDKGLFDGQGYLSTNGSIYRGSFKEGFPDGYGEYKSKEGWTYKGPFNLGVFDGNGTIIKEDGTEVSGSWEKGRRVG